VRRVTWSRKGGEGTKNETGDRESGPARYPPVSEGAVSFLLQ
jgi:hypothetical protein